MHSVLLSTIVLNSRDQHIKKHGIPLFVPPQHASQYIHLTQKTNQNAFGLCCDNTVHLLNSGYENPNSAIM